MGILLALPVAAVLAVILRHVHDTYKQSQIYGIEESLLDDNLPVADSVTDGEKTP